MSNEKSYDNGSAFSFPDGSAYVGTVCLNKSWTWEHSVHSDKGAPNMLCFLCILKVNGVKMLRPVRGKRIQFSHSVMKHV